MQCSRSRVCVAALVGGLVFVTARVNVALGQPGVVSSYSLPLNAGSDSGGDNTRQVTLSLGPCDQDNGPSDLGTSQAAWASQFFPDLPDWYEVADDFIFDPVDMAHDCRVDSILITAVHGLHRGGCVNGGGGTCLDTPDDYVTFRVTIYNDAGDPPPAKMPGGQPLFPPDVGGTHVGDVFIEMVLTPGMWSYVPSANDLFPMEQEYDITLDVSSFNVDLVKDVKYWLVIAPEWQLTDGYQFFWLSTSRSTGHPSMQYRGVEDDDFWTPLDDDMGFLLLGAPDCNENGIPDECDLDCGAPAGPCDLPGCGGSADCNANDHPDECDLVDCAIAPACDPCSECFGGGVTCGLFTGGCPDAPPDHINWSCFENWDLPGDQYPDDELSAPDVFVTLEALDEVFLNVNVTIPALKMLPDSTLLATQTTGAGNLLFSEPAVAAIYGTIYLDDGVTIGEPAEEGNPDPMFILGPEGVYEKNPNPDAPPVSAALYAQDLFILGDAGCFPPGCPPSGVMTLSDQMSLHTVRDLVLERDHEGFRGGGITPPPKLRAQDSTHVDVGRDMSMQGSSEVELADNATVLVGSDLALDGVGSDACAARAGITPPPKFSGIDSVDMVISGDLILMGSVDFTYTSVNPIQLGGDFINLADGDSSCFDCEGGIILPGAARDAAPREHTFEAAGRDVGPLPVGLVDNFALGSLEVASGAAVTFVDAFDNVPTQDCEALYVGNLVFRPGSTVVIDNCKVYYNTLDDGDVVPNIQPGCGELLPITGGVIPAVSGWGLAVVILSLVVGILVVFSRGRTEKS